jgi:hypothetical protein
MSQGSDATAAGEGQQEREENQWIKSLSRLDLLDMRQSGQDQSGGELMTAAGRRKPTDAPLILT